jgi:hypothetical protein
MSDLTSVSIAPTGTDTIDSAPASAEGASSAAVAGVVPVALKHHRPKGKVRIGRRGIASAPDPVKEKDMNITVVGRLRCWREHNSSETLGKSLLDRDSLYGNHCKVVLDWSIQHFESPLGNVHIGKESPPTLAMVAGAQRQGVRFH